MAATKIATIKEAGVSIVAPSALARVSTDVDLVALWVAALSSSHSQRNFAATALRFLEALPIGIGLRNAKVEHVREALDAIARGRSSGTARQYVLQVKSLLSYAQRLEYIPFNIGAFLKVKSAPRGAEIANRTLSEGDVKRLIRAARSKRDRLLFCIAYAGGLRVSELVGLTWADVTARKKGIRIMIRGKGGVVRQVFLPNHIRARLLELRGDAGANDPVFASRTGGHLTERAVHAMVKCAGHAAGINEAVSPHWLRHAHGSHALARGASLLEVKTTLGHANAATTSGYLHARPDSWSALYLDARIFR
jgi:integrase/recombinase XerD